MIAYLEEMNVACIDRFTDQILRQLDSQLQCCEVESPESAKGACDGMPCCRDAVVFDLRDEREKCLQHFLRDLGR